MEEYKQTLNIKTWAEEDRPREKLILKGRSALSDAELIAILIGSGSREETAVELSKRILASVNNNLGLLSKLNTNELSKFKGMGEAKALSIIAALELGRRRKEVEPTKQETLNSSQAVYNEMRPTMLDLQHEEFWVLLMNRASKLIKKEKLSSGGITGTVVDVRILFKTALENSATSIIVCHNHPSGNKEPSDEDIKITKEIVAAGNMLNIPLQDHLIFTDHGYFSFTDEFLI